MEAQSDKHIGYQEALGEHASNPPTPRTVGETIRALGKEWTVSSCEARIKAQFEKFLHDEAKKVIADEEDPNEADHLRSIYIADRTAGHYTWIGKHSRKAQCDIPGVVHLLYLLLKRCHPNIDKETAFNIFQENPMEVGMAIRWSKGMLGNSQPLKDEGNPPTL